MTHKTNTGLLRSAVILIVLLILCSCGTPEQDAYSEPGVYDEKKCFVYNDYFLQMDEEGRFEVVDILCKTSQSIYVMSGTYYLYESELVLIKDQKDIKLVFAADGDNWVYHQKESEGTDLLKFTMEDQAIWESWPMNSE